MSETFAGSALKEIPPKAADLSAWYTAVCLRAELVSYSPVRGCVVLRPYGFGMWENLQRQLDERFKATGHENAYFPLLIPESLLIREAEHVEGFAPEVAWVTQGGSEKLTERLAIRPTSEAMVGTMYAQWVESYRDLPILINQWANVVRWEKATRPFLRTMEFLWQEGHTAHATAAEGREETLRMLEVYRDFAENVAAIPVYHGRKSASERFPGAVETFSIEALMPDGKALQSGTSHDLGQNFAKAYDIKFVDSDRAIKYAYTTSWGVSWRMLGGMIMAHGDDRGLRIPPKMAPIEAILVPIVRSNDRRAVERCEQLAASLKAAGFRARVDTRDEQPGWKYSEWDMRGVPIRIEMGPRDVDAGSAVLARRDRAKGDPDQRESVPLDRIEAVLRAPPRRRATLALRASESISRSHTFVTEKREEFFELLHGRAGMVDIAWCERPECEARDQSRDRRDDAHRTRARAARRSSARLAESRRKHGPILHNRISFRVGAVVAAVALMLGIAGAVSQAYTPSVADLDATARASGNRRDLAEHIGESVFATEWPAEVSHISANELGSHLIVGIRIWGVKFHKPLTRDEFVDEVVGLVGKTFAAVPSAEEIDVWTSVPIVVGRDVVVSGDLAKPTSRLVFSLTVRRDEPDAKLRARAYSGEGVFWDQEWVRSAFKEAM